MRIAMVTGSSHSLGPRAIVKVATVVLAGQLAGAGAQVAMSHYLRKVPRRGRPILFLHNAVTDLLLAWNATGPLSAFAAAARSQNSLPGFDSWRSTSGCDVRAESSTAATPRKSWSWCWARGEAAAQTTIAAAACSVTSSHRSIEASARAGQAKHESGQGAESLDRPSRKRTFGRIGLGPVIPRRANNRPRHPSDGCARRIPSSWPVDTVSECMSATRRRKS